MAEIDLKDVLSIALQDLPNAEVQRAIVDEIEKMKLQGYSEQQALKLVFDNNKIGNKAH